MPDKTEKEKRKQIARYLRLKARQEFEKSLPMNRNNFKSLFDHLDEQLSNKGCGHNLSLSIAYLKSIKPDNIDEITSWFQETEAIVIVKYFIT